MAIKNKTISRELNEQLRSVRFNSSPSPDNEAISDIIDPPIISKKKTIKPRSLNKRVVSLEYLDKLEKMAIAQTRYESIKDFSHLLSNLSIVLLSISIITYLIFYFISAQTPSLISLLIIAFEAFALLGITLYTISSTSTLKQLADLTASDFSTCSHIIGNPKAETYIPPDETDIADETNEANGLTSSDIVGVTESI